MANYLKSREKLLKELEKLKRDKPFLKSVQNGALNKRKVTAVPQNGNDINQYESEINFRHVVDTAPVMIWMSGTDTVRNYFNKFWLDFSGQSLEQELNNGWTEGIHSDDLQHFIYISLASFNKKKQFETEYRFCNKKGEYRWVLDRGVPRFSNDGIFLGYIGSCMDITSRKQVDELLFASENKYRSLFENMQAGFSIQEIITDEDGHAVDFRYIEMNAAYERQSGFKSKEVIGKTILEIDPRAGASLIENYGKAALTGKPLQFDYFSKAVGQHLHVHAFCAQPGQIAAIVEDITLRKSEEASIRGSEEIFRAIVQTSPDAIGLFDINWTTLMMNTAAAEIFGYESPMEMMGKNVFDFFLPEDKIKAFEMIQKVFNIGMLKDAEYSFLRKEGTSFKAEFSCTVLYDTDGEPRSILAVVHDITERKQMEEKITISNIELEKSNAEKDKLFSIIAHDLRAPITGFIGLTEIMASEDEELSLEEYTQLSISLHKVAANVYLLLENLLKWAMHKQGTLDFLPEEQSIYDIFSQCIISIEERALQKGITIFSETSGVQKIVADEQMIDTVLRNLLSNAVKFTKRGGQVTVNAKENGDGMIEISVKDTGMGMSEDLIHKLFILGEKVGRNGTDDEASTGLGLILCKEFVEKHNGKIWVESQENVGSTFTFTIPKQ